MMFGKVQPERDIIHCLSSMKLEPVEIIRGGTVTCTFAADAGKDVNMLIYAILDQKNIEEFTMTANGSLQNFRISTAPLPPGEYMVKVQCGRDFKSGKFNVV